MSITPDIDHDGDELGEAAVTLRRQINALLLELEPDVVLIALIGCIGGVALKAGVNRDGAHHFADSCAKDLHAFFDVCFDQVEAPPAPERMN